MLSGESADEPVTLDGNSKTIAISALHEIKRRKTVYDNCPLILEGASEPAKRYDLRLASTRSDSINEYIKFLMDLKLLERVEDTGLFQSTELGSQYLKSYLNFILFNYLG